MLRSASRVRDRPRIAGKFIGLNSGPRVSQQLEKKYLKLGGKTSHKGVLQIGDAFRQNIDINITKGQHQS
jgi:hypothetical protein